MDVTVSDELELSAAGTAPVRLTPMEAFELAERLVRAGIRVAMLEEADAVEREQGNAEPART